MNSTPGFRVLQALVLFGILVACAIAANLYFGEPDWNQLQEWTASLTRDFDNLSRFAAPVAFISLATLVVPLLPLSARALHRFREDTRLSFSAIRCSTRDYAWTADKVSSKDSRSKRSADYPFAQPYAHRLTCWRGMLLNTGADPVLDVTLVNRSKDAFLIASIGFEVMSVGSIQERRDPVVPKPADQPELADCHVLPVPDTQELLRRARVRHDGHDTLTVECNVEEAIELNQPLYLRPSKMFRFDLQLSRFSERTPLHALGRIVVHTDSGAFRSPVIYFRR
jgi:hypothetical protein